MIWLFIIASLVIPAVLLGLRFLLPAAAFWIDAAALLALYVFGIQAAAAVADVLMKNTVMMTEIHKIFRSPVFLVSGGFLGQYGFYRGWLGLLRYRESS